MSINPPQSFDLTARNLHKAFNKWLKEVSLFFWSSEIRRWKAVKTGDVVKKKKSLIVYLLRRKSQQIYQSLIVKNMKGETVKKDNERTLEMVIETFKGFCKPMKTFFLGKEQIESFED